MSHYHEDNANFKVKVDEYEMDSVDEDEMEIENINFGDTSASQARRGKDIQGINWKLYSIGREEYRKFRLEQYKNYENIPNSSESSKKANVFEFSTPFGFSFSFSFSFSISILFLYWYGKRFAYFFLTWKQDCKITQTGALYYDFRQNTRSLKSTILHFQLRNLVWATSKHDVYFMSNNSVVHWSSLTCNKSEILNLSGDAASTVKHPRSLLDDNAKHPRSLLDGYANTQVSTLAVKDNLLVSGGFQGELIWKDLDQPGVSFCFQTNQNNAITNCVEIYANPSGAIHFTASNNDGGVRDFNAEKCMLFKEFIFPWPVNHTSVSPDGKLLVVVGDSVDGLMVDSSTGKTLMPFCGHLDYSFASAWHPDGVTFATGNQDQTCRIWDARNLSKSVAVLRGKIGAIRSIRYTSDGQYMAMGEAADFVHVYDAKSGYEREQEIDFFGEISGISFSPDTETVFIGVVDKSHGSILEYSRRRRSSNLVSVGTDYSNASPV